MMSQYALEILKVLAGIANAERVSADNRELANTSIHFLLKGLKEEFVKESLEKNGIELNT